MRVPLYKLLYFVTLFLHVYIYIGLRHYNSSRTQELLCNSIENSRRFEVNAYIGGRVSRRMTKDSYHTRESARPLALRQGIYLHIYEAHGAHI